VLIIGDRRSYESLRSKLGRSRAQVSGEQPHGSPVTQACVRSDGYYYGRTQISPTESEGQTEGQTKLGGDTTAVGGDAKLG
jgi:hypothetical protein